MLLDSASSFEQILFEEEEFKIEENRRARALQDTSNSSNVTNETMQAYEDIVAFISGFKPDTFFSYLP